MMSLGVVLCLRLRVIVRLRLCILLMRLGMLFGRLLVVLRFWLIVMLGVGSVCLAVCFLRFCRVSLC